MTLATILRLVPWAIAALAVAWALVERSDYYGCVAARAKDKAAAEELARATQELDQRHVAEIVAQAEADKLELRREAQSREDAINRAPVGACPNAGPFGALFDGVRRRQHDAGSGQAPGSGRSQ